MPNTPKLPEDVEKRFERFELEFIEKREETRNKFGGVNIYRKLKIEKDISDVVNWYENEIATLKAQVRKEIEKKIIINKNGYVQVFGMCTSDTYNQALTDCLSIASLKEASNE
jgi:hypothetical protein